MRRSWLASALAASALTLTAAPALAHKVQTGVSHKFIGSESAEVRASAAGSQEFKFSPFTITCEKAKAVKDGALPTWPSASLLLELKYSGCEASASVHGGSELELKAKFLTPVTLNYNANGFVEAGSGGTVTGGKLEGADDIEIAVSGAIKCTIDVEPGTYPTKAIKKPEEQYEAASYKVEEVKIEKGKKTNTKDRLAITTALSKMPYELEGEYCEALSKTEGKGSYAGSLVAELPKGNLGWE